MSQPGSRICMIRSTSGFNFKIKQLRRPREQKYNMDVWDVLERYYGFARVVVQRINKDILVYVHNA